MSRAKPYYQSPLVMSAIQDVTFPDPVGPLVDGVLGRDEENPREGASKRVAFALYNHYYKEEDNLLVSGEQERWPLITKISQKNREIGVQIPDLLVQKFDINPGHFSDLIFCEAKRIKPDKSYEKILQQISDAAHLKAGINEHVFVNVIYGTKVYFFNMYDVETKETNYKDLVPIYPKHLDPEDLEKLGMILHCYPDNKIYACEMDLLNNKHWRLIDVYFRHMSRSAGPVDPEVSLLCGYCLLINN